MWSLLVGKVREKSVLVFLWARKKKKILTGKDLGEREETEITK